MLKKILAVLTVIGILAGIGAFADPAAGQEELKQAFVQGLEALLSSVTPGTRDRLDLDVTSQGNAVFSAQVDGTEQLGSLRLIAPTRGFDAELQASDEDLYISYAQQVFGVKFADLPAIRDAVIAVLQKTLSSSVQAPALDTSALSQLDPAILREIGATFVQIVIGRDVAMQSDGTDTHVAYSSSGKKLIANLADFIDVLLANEKYRPTLEILWGVLAQYAVQADPQAQAPSLDEAIAAWPQAKQNMLATETDVSVKLELDIAQSRGTIDLTGEIGSPEHLYMMSWSAVNDEELGRSSLAGRLTERYVSIDEAGSPKNRDYFIDIAFDSTQSDEGTMWTASVNWPARSFRIKLQGNHIGRMGNASWEIAGYERQTGDLDYVVTDGGAAIRANWAGQRDGGSFSFRAASTSCVADVTTSHYGEEKNVLHYSVFTDEEGNVTSLSVVTEGTSVNYDGEAFVVAMNGMTIRCTAQFVSETEYLITMSPEGIPDSRPAYIRVTYGGEEGDWNCKAAVVDPEGNEVMSAKLTCSPAQGVDPLSAKENAVTITPEMAAQIAQGLIAQIMQNLQNMQYMQ